MAEPTSSAGSAGLMSVAIAMLGPMAGPYALLIAMALAGAQWPLSQSEGGKSGAFLVLRCVLTSLAFTGLLVSLISSHWKFLDAELIFSPVAFLIAAMGNGWRPVFSTINDGLVEVTRRFKG